MSIYDDMRAVTTEVLAEFGQGIVQYIKLTPGTGPADNPGPATEDAPLTINAVVTGVDFKYVQAGLAVASDKTVTFGQRDDIVPNIRDFLTVDGVRYKIVQITNTPAAGKPVKHSIIVRS